MRQEKQLLADEFLENLENYGSSFIITRYTNLTPLLAYTFRKQMRQVGAKFSVVKKRLLRKVAEINNLPVDPSLKGHIGIVFTGKDPVNTTKTLYNFSKDNENVFDVVEGYVEGSQLNAEQMKQLSMLPGKEAMRAQFLGTLEAPMSQTLAVMQALLTSVIYCVDNKSK